MLNCCLNCRAMTGNGKQLSNGFFCTYCFKKLQMLFELVGGGNEEAEENEIN